MGDLDRVPVVLVTRNCGYQRAKRSGDKGRQQLVTYCMRASRALRRRRKSP